MNNKNTLKNLLYNLKPIKRHHFFKAGTGLTLVSLLALSFAFNQNKARLPFADPENDGLETASGLETKLFANAPMTLNLTNMDIDAKGRVWVTEAVNYRLQHNPQNEERKEGDRILILEDVDGDGRADKQKVFYQGKDVDAALGIAVLGNKVIVSASPNVFVFTDTDGDDKADKKELLFTGIGGVQHDHGMHTFTFGPDGKLYFNFGNEGQQIKDKNGNPIKDQAGNIVANNGKPYRQGMVFRCNPDGGEFEVLAHNFRNNYEVAVDSYGTLWQSDNDDDGNRGVRINYVLPYGNYGYQDEKTGAGWSAYRTGMESEIPIRHWHLNDPGVVPNLLQTGAGSPTGILIYEGKLLSAPFRNQMIHSDAGPNVVRAYPVTPDGAGYKAKIVNVVKGVKDQWFRPSDVTVAPDGSLFISDWYDPGVGGHQQGEAQKGRVFRVAPPNTPYTVPKLDLTTTSGAVQALQSPNLATRYLAWQKLHSEGKKAEKELAKLWKTGESRMRARALWLLSKIEGSGNKYLEQAYKDADPNIRITGLRAAQELKLNVVPVLKAWAKDPNPHIRREVAIALRYNKSPEAPAIWTDLISQYDGQDRWYLEALGIASDLQADSFYKGWVSKGGGDISKTADREIIRRIRTAEALPKLAQLINNSKTPTELNYYFRSFDFHENSPTKQQVLIGLLEGNNPLQKQITTLALQHSDSKSVEGNPKFQTALRKTVDSAKGTNKFVMLLNQYSLPEYNPELAKLALAKPDSAIGWDAARALVRNNGTDLIQKTLNSSDPITVTAMITALSNNENKQVKDLLAGILQDSKRPIVIRKLALQKYGQGGSGENLLVEMVKNRQLPTDLEETAATILLRAWRPEIKEAAALYFKKPSRAGKPLAPIAQLTAMTGDAVNGKAVFEQSCAMCHKVNETGAWFGPELSEIGSKLPKLAIYNAILHPDAGISFGYEGYIIKVKDGTQTAGIISSQTEDKLDLRLPGGTVVSYPMKDVTSKQKMENSMMPANLQQGMTEKELVNLVEYLASLKKIAAK
ncbi:PVC-type heme-binding CxxCH protein [Adhaeribacter aquaticus]|uniref:PVC-type heme-binding CxxCH protein n=1 Tax=Adhaeribacter aquaticus TaxID=299567 RepID=UPI0004037EF9|nr:PVC-type heme-binding CxxCH protein [Adhaeribacter aquaticus]